MSSPSKSSVYPLVMTAVMAAVICVLAPLSIPIGPVPISLTNLAIYFTLYILGWKRGTAAYVVYLFLGLMGAPVFSGFRGGFAHLFGATGGYIIGFIPMAVLAGLVIEKSRSRVLQISGMILGTLIAYAFGTAWYCFVAKSALVPALTLCVFPFIPFDLLKMVAATVAGPVLADRLEQAGLHPAGIHKAETCSKNA